MESGLERRFSHAERGRSGPGPLPMRPYGKGANLSIIGLGGMALAGMSQDRANRLVADALARGVNYFDVAPSYGGGSAEEMLSTALGSHRDTVFLASKTLERSAVDAHLDLERSLRRLRRGHIDLFQFHAVNKAEDVRRILAPGGAAEAVLRARDKGLVRFLGFSSHSAPVALTLLDLFAFDSILFPVKFVCYAQGNFGPQVVQKAHARGVTCLAIKSLARSPWRTGELREYPNCWYRPLDDPSLARLALRFTLSEEICALLPPGDERLVRLALDLAVDYQPITDEERQGLFEKARGLKPIMTAKKQI